MSTPTGFVVVTGALGSKLNAANTGAGVKNPDGSVNVAGTVLGITQTTQSVAEYATVGSKLGKWVPGVGGLLNVGAAVLAVKNIKTAFADGQPINQSDIAELVGAAAGTGALLITSTGLIVPLTVVALAAGGYQLAAQAGGWTVDLSGKAANRLPTAAEAVEINNNVAQLKQQNTLANPVATINNPTGLDTTRDSSTFITTADTHSVTINSGGTLSDAFVLQKTQANSFANADEFYAAVLASNPQISDVNQVAAATTLYLPQKMANGSITYYYANGTVINSNAVTGEYDTTVPDGNGRQVHYERTGNADSGYTLFQTTTDSTGLAISTFTGIQAGEGIEITPTALTQSTTTDAITTTTIDSDADTVTDIIHTATTNADGTQTITVDQAADGVIDSTSSANTLAKGVQLSQDDKNNDGVVDGTSIITTLNTGRQFTQDVSDAENVQKEDANMAAWFKSGQLDQASYQSYSAWSTAPLIDASVTVAAPAWAPAPGTTYDGKKAFYETTTTSDTSPSIATSTGVLLDAKQNAMTTAQLIALDLDKNSKLASTELTGLQIWKDLNEDGLLDAGELTTLSDAGITQLNSAGYPFYTQGNSAWVDPATANVEPPVPESNYRSLRDSDNRYYVSKTQWIDFAADQIKINDTKRNTLIGTDGDDNFDANYYKVDSVDNTLLRNFLAGPGNDVMGGSVQSDSLWGGDGDDTVWGYAGNDWVYGEGGKDELHGGEGNDVLAGGVGQDNLFGGVGNDTLVGGEGDDVLTGFNPINDPEQTLSKGQTDDDLLYGGLGNDHLYGGLGNDHLYGGLGNDEASGGEGNDRLYGGDGTDRLFGGVGNDVLYGGEGDDLIYGFTPTNDPKQTLNADEFDNDWLYGGAGTDTLIAGVGNDYLDGGAGADSMQGGLGDDAYIVNSVNDVITEQAGEGIDTVMSGANYMLNANIEVLRLLGGSAINGTGNSADNHIIGNRSDNLLDGVTGADTMLGGLGNDTYVVDNTGDRITELADQGIDTVQSKISYTLADNLENLSLLDFSNPEPGSLDGVSVLVYGQPRANALDYTQGDGVASYKGTCGLTAIANIAAQAGMSVTEGQAVQKAIDNQWCETDATKTDEDRGTSNYLNQQALMSSYGINNQVIQGYNEAAIANLIKAGRGVIMGINAGKLWGGNTNANYDFGVVDHVITITGAVYDASSGALAGFYIADSGRGKVDDQARYITAADLKVAAEVGLGYTIYTTDPIKLWDENTNAVGNSLDNTLTGNRANNILNGLAGNDTLIGGAGNDTYRFGLGAGVDTIIETDAAAATSTTTADNADTIAIGAGVNQEQLWFSQSGNDLVMSIIGSKDQSIIKDWYLGSTHQVEQINTADGKTLLNTDVQKLVEVMSGLTPPAMDTTVLSDAQKTTLAPVIAASWH